jgi:hypothetical protein
VTAYTDAPAPDDDPPRTNTDSNGDYTIDGLAAGTYHVRFDSCNFSPLNFAPLWWNSKASFGLSDPVTVTSGSTTNGIDAELADGATIDGTVTDSNGPVRNDCVTVLDAAGDELASTVTNAAGVYSIGGFASGDVFVQFGGCRRDHVPEYFDNATSLAAATPIHLTAPNNRHDVDAVLAISGEIAGKVTRTDGTPMDGVCVRAFDAASGDELGDGEPETTPATGRYVITGLAAGSYKLEFDPCDPGDEIYAAEFYDDKSSLAEAGTVAVSTGQRTSGIDAALALKPVPGTEPVPPEPEPEPTPPDNPKDTKAPTVKIDKAPKRHGSDRTPTILFSADEGNVSFFCALDGRDPTPCASPKKLRRLDSGRHHFAVYGIDAAGNQGEPAKAKFKVEPKAHHHHGHHANG